MADKSLLEASTEITYEALQGLMSGPTSNNLYFLLVANKQNYKILATELINGLFPPSETGDPDSPPIDINEPTEPPEDENPGTEPETEPEE